MSKLLSKFFKVTLSVLVCTCFFVACTGRPSGVLNQSDMADVLTDLHKLDGSLAAKGLMYGSSPEKTAYYNSVLKKHGVTKAQFDSSLVWYTKNPMRFDRVYTNVMLNLDNQAKDIRNGKYHPIDSVELDKIKFQIWNKRTKYVLTKDSVRTHIDFEIPDQNFMLGDVYVLRFIQRIGREDSCAKPVIRLQINYLNGKVHSVVKTAYHDAVTRRYTFRLTSIYPYKIKSITGQLLGSSAYKGKLNAKVDSITLTRIFRQSKQDSLLKILQVTDSLHYKKPISIVKPPMIRTRNIRSLILQK